MNYISTRNNHKPVCASEAIALGMVPHGGLFVPESLPKLALPAPGESYQQVAKRILTPLLGDFSPKDIDASIAAAYNKNSFESKEIAPLLPLDSHRSVLELWHGPTAAFKDVALQIMPSFLTIAKRNRGDKSHTVILVATSGDTGKAALEGFKDCPGISIIVFYPHKGVSEVQKLQMTTTGGGNTHVVAVKGNFDDCQTAVKKLLCSADMRDRFEKQGIRFSSANSINWGRLCPQIVYYWTAYLSLVKRSAIKSGDPVDFCVPTGNFGNILAGYYAMRMGLPVSRLICASNKNNVLADFFATGLYDANRKFFRTMSPSMDILISSNLERYLFEMTSHDAWAVNIWSASLAENGSFSVDDESKKRMAKLIFAGWVDEKEVLSVIGRVHKKSGYVLDTHTAVAAALCDRIPPAAGRHTVIASTASPYKSSRHVLEGMTGEKVTDEFQAIDRIAKLSGLPVHRAIAGLRQRAEHHTKVIDIADMEKTVCAIAAKVAK
ncbi:MAG: threonine synthase [Chitinispirillaceae bacterium]|jgi:threonine synthase|nr:threonine synthase [Chitinispirillaceae bacterium]